MFIFIRLYVREESKVFAMVFLLFRTDFYLYSTLLFALRLSRMYLEWRYGCCQLVKLSIHLGIHKVHKMMFYATLCFFFASVLSEFEFIGNNGFH